MKTGLIFSVRSDSVDGPSGFHPLWSGSDGHMLGEFPLTGATDEIMEGFETGELLEESGYVGADLSDARFGEQDLEGVDFHGALLTGADFSRANLRMADFRACLAPGAAFAMADLTFADLAGSDLCGADFRSADLCHADLTGALLANANFEGADLEYAMLAQADLRGADLTGVDLRAAFLSGARIDERTRLPFSREDAFSQGMVFITTGPGDSSGAERDRNERS